MKIAVASAFRDMVGRTNRWYSQLAALQRSIGRHHQVEAIAVEGDSATDQTAAELDHFAELWQIPLHLTHHHHGGPTFGSTEAPERLRALSGVLEEGLRAAGETDADVFVWIESDLVWFPDAIEDLVHHAANRSQGFDIVAPLVFAGANFYDVWGFRGFDGERFSPAYPYHRTIQHEPGLLTEVHSAGSCLAMRTEIARRVPGGGNEMALVGWCDQARAAGYRIGVAPDIRIDHPA